MAHAAAGAAGREAGRRRDAIRRSDGGARDPRRRGGGCCSSSSASPSASAASSCCGRSCRTCGRAIARDARSLAAADVTLSTGRPWDPKTRALIDERLARRCAVPARTEGIEVSTMVRPADPRRPVAKLAEVRGVQAGFPLYGTVELQDGRPYSHALVAGPRRAGPAGTARAARLAGRRRHPDRLEPVHHPRRPGLGAGPARGGLQLRPARPGRRRRPRGHRAARLRQPRVARHPAEAARARRSSRWRRRCARDLSRAVRQRAVVPRQRGPRGRGPDAGRELPEPGRPRHRDPRAASASGA